MNQGRNPGFETKRYYTFSSYLKKRFGKKIHKISVDGGFTCPNRDGTRGWGGCIYCNNSAFTGGKRTTEPVLLQIENSAEFIRRRFSASGFIIYFQSYTNTYAPVEKLRRLYSDALRYPGVVGLSVGTRPDCVGEEVLDLLEETAESGLEVWIELGLQSIDDKILRWINRGHTTDEFFDAVERIKKRKSLLTCVHMILGFPGETEETRFKAAGMLRRAGIEGLKLHPLHVLRKTKLERIYYKEGIRLPTLEEYSEMVCGFIERTSKDVVIHRLTGETDPGFLVSPWWCEKKYKQKVLMEIDRKMEEKDTWQGKIDS